MKRIGLLLTLLLLGMMFFTGCIGSPVPAANETDECSIALSGLPEEKQIRLSELKEIPPTQGEAISINSNGEEKTVTYKGAELGDVLAGFGADKASFTGLRLVAEDGYAVEVPAEILRNREIILAYELNGKVLDEGNHPVRVVVPEERAMYWLKYLSEIRLFSESEAVMINSVCFFENEMKALPASDYDYYGTVDKAVSLAELLGSTGDAKVVLIGRDGLVKNELLETAKYDYSIKYTGEGAPLYLAPGLPLGMHVKELAAIISGDNAIVFAASFAGADGRFAGGAIVETLREYWPDKTITLTDESGREEALAVSALEDRRFVLTETGVRAER